MYPEPLTLDELKIMSGTTFGLSEEQWRKVQFVFMEVIGNQQSDRYQGPYDYLYVAYDELAGILIHPFSDWAITDTISIIVQFLGKLYFFGFNQDVCRKVLRPREKAWHGKLGLMKMAVEEETADRIAEQESFGNSEEQERDLKIAPAVQPVDTGTGKSSDSTCLRSRQIDEFLRSCNELSAKKILRSHLWKSFGYRSSRQFEYWQSCNNEKVNTTDSRAFESLLNTAPRDFIQRLILKKLIPEDSVSH